LLSEKLTEYCCGSLQGVCSCVEGYCFCECSQDYATALDLMQELILTTDVAEHLKAIKEIEQMVQGVWTLFVLCR